MSLSFSLNLKRAAEYNTAEHFRPSRQHQQIPAGNESAIRKVDNFRLQTALDSDGEFSGNGDASTERQGTTLSYFERSQRISKIFFTAVLPKMCATHAARLKARTVYLWNVFEKEVKEIFSGQGRGQHSKSRARTTKSKTNKKTSAERQLLKSEKDYGRDRQTMYSLRELESEEHHWAIPEPLLFEEGPSGAEEDGTARKSTSGINTNRSFSGSKEKSTSIPSPPASSLRSENAWFFLALVIMFSSRKYLFKKENLFRFWLWMRIAAACSTLWYVLVIFTLDEGQVLDDLGKSAEMETRSLSVDGSLRSSTLHGAATRPEHSSVGGEQDNAFSAGGTEMIGRVLPEEENAAASALTLFDKKTGAEQQNNEDRIDSALLKEKTYWQKELEATKIHLETLIRISSAEQASGGSSDPFNPYGGLGGGPSPYGGGFMDDYLGMGMRDSEFLHTRQYPGMMGGLGGYGGGFGGGGFGGGLRGQQALLQHTGDMYCRTPQCSRDYPACRNSFFTNLPCCSDLMFVMLADVAELLEKLHIPYFLLYGTLLGGVRDQDIIQHTQDIDLVVDRRYWELFAQAVLAPESLHNFVFKNQKIADLLLENLRKEARVVTMTADSGTSAAIATSKSAGAVLEPAFGGSEGNTQAEEHSRSRLAADIVGEHGVGGREKVNEVAGNLQGATSKMKRSGQTVVTASSTSTSTSTSSTFTSTTAMAKLALLIDQESSSSSSSSESEETVAAKRKKDLATAGIAQLLGSASPSVAPSGAAQSSSVGKVENNGSTTTAKKSKKKVQKSIAEQVLPQQLLRTTNADGLLQDTFPTSLQKKASSSPGKPDGASKKSSDDHSSKSAPSSARLISKQKWKHFFKGIEKHPSRRYNFGVDQWEQKVARVCADYAGFPSTQFKPSSDVKSDPLNNLDMFGEQTVTASIERGVDYHLDFYNVDWWVFEEMKLADCVGDGKKIRIRDRYFSVPARPRACVEKLYGADWKTPRVGLNGVN
ncbi:unnamed protein product [Amoebophrya sp. A120]|nr:unnamed protein product [Amoebophrya sp. A120]|eukprot:GSA120T00003855001.1